MPKSRWLIICVCFILFSDYCLSEGLSQNSPTTTQTTVTTPPPASVPTGVASGAQEDEIISKLAKEQIRNDSRINAPNIDVKTNNGIVVIIGTFNTIGEAAAAIEQASSVPGVKDVDTSRMVLSTGITQGFDDAAISAKIRGKFFRENLFADRPDTINIETKYGVVYLSGRVETETQAQKAVFLAKTVPNVKNVISKIIVTYPPPPP